MAAAMNANPIRAARHAPSQIGGSGGILISSKLQLLSSPMR